MVEAPGAFFVFVDAMILAAGYGSRLRPLTDTIPKALVEVGNRPMLDIVAGRLVRAGATRLIVNAHHHADLLERFLSSFAIPGVEVVLSDERDGILDTGGGLLNARPHFSGDAPFFLHNVDIYSDIDLVSLYDAHTRVQPLVTLAVNQREASRYLMFDDGGLVGHGNRTTGFRHDARTSTGTVRCYGFCGIHVISPGIFDMIVETGSFSIVTLYMRLASIGARIVPHVVGSDRCWIDIGKPDQLALARSTAEDARRHKSFPPL